MLLSDLHVAIEGVEAALLLDLVHVQVEDVTVPYHIVAHVHSLAELLVGRRCVDEGQTGLSGYWRHVRLVAVVSHALELLAGLRVRVREVHVAMGLVTLLCCNEGCSKLTVAVIFVPAIEGVATERSLRCMDPM